MFTYDCFEKTEKKFSSIRNERIKKTSTIYLLSPSVTNTTVVTYDKPIKHLYCTQNHINCTCQTPNNSNRIGLSVYIDI